MQAFRHFHHITKTVILSICASPKQKQQIIKMQRLWNVFQVSAVELERACVQKNSANEINEKYWKKKLELL